MNQLRSRLTPPTFVPTNSFTSGFQALVNTYGTPRYREVNPGAFCCILFPYLFGIMFGDFGHGLLFALFGLYLISKEKEWEGKDLGDMLEMVYGGRYICFLNGVFGAFVGALTLVPSRLLPLLSLFTAPLLVMSYSAQLSTNMRRKSTGQLSPGTVLLRG